MAAIAEWSGSQRAEESPPHGVGTGEATSTGDLVQSLSGSLQHSLRGFNAHLQNVAGGRNYQLSCEHALEVAYAHGHVAGRHPERELLLKIFRNPHLKFLNGFHLLSLCGQ